MVTFLMGIFGNSVSHISLPIFETKADQSLTTIYGQKTAQYIHIYIYIVITVYIYIYIYLGSRNPLKIKCLERNLGYRTQPFKKKGRSYKHRVFL